MSTTQTSHEPSPDELDHATRDGAGAESHAATTSGHGGDGEHPDAGEALGPVDVKAWGALLLGIAAGLVIVLCLVITNGLVTATPA